MGKDEYRRNPQLRRDHTILCSPEHLTPFEKAKIRTVFRHHDYFGELQPEDKPELWEEYTEGEYL